MHLKVWQWHAPSSKNSPQATAIDRPKRAPCKSTKSLTKKENAHDGSTICLVVDKSTLNRRAELSTQNVSSFYRIT